MANFSPPPPLPMNPRYSASSIASTSNLNSTFNPSSTSASTTTTLPRDQINDALTRDFPDIANLTREEMTSLLEDENYFDAHFGLTPQALELNQSLESRLKGNIDLAQHSEGMKPHLDKLRSETAQVFHEAVDLKMRWSLIEEAQNDAYKRFTPTPQLNRLRAATSIQEHLSETLVENFISGTMEEESFTKQYREVRKVFHTRDINLGKWEEGKVVWR